MANTRRDRLTDSGQPKAVVLLSSRLQPKERTIAGREELEKKLPTLVGSISINWEDRNT